MDNIIYSVAYKFIYTMLEYGINFHPDTPFDDYVDLETGERTFSDAEANDLNNILTAIIDACINRGHDIYEISIAAFNAWRAAP